MTTQEELEVMMRLASQDIRTQCKFVIVNSTNKDLIEFAKLILEKAQ